MHAKNDNTDQNFEKLTGKIHLWNSHRVHEFRPVGGEKSVVGKTCGTGESLAWNKLVVRSDTESWTSAINLSNNEQHL